MHPYQNIIVELNLFLERLEQVIRDSQDLTSAQREEATHLHAILETCLIVQSAHDPHRVLPAMAQLCRVIGAHSMSELSSWGDTSIFFEQPRPATENDPEDSDT
jgi:hypothetical protein